MTCVEQERCIQCTVGPFGPYVTPANWPAYLLDLCLLFFRILLCLLGQPLQLLGSELWSTEKKCEYINKYPTLSYLLSDIGLRFSLEHTFNWKSVSVKRWWETESDIWSVYNKLSHRLYGQTCWAPYYTLHLQGLLAIEPHTMQFPKQFMC